MTLLLLKLSLVPAAVLIATLAARRYGHAISGLLAGLPMIAAPITAMLLLDHEPAHVAGIATATLASVPASIAFIVAYAWASRRLSWWQCLALASVAYVTTGTLTTMPGLPAATPFIAALAGPPVGLALMPRPKAQQILPHVPNLEVFFRLLLATLLAAAVIIGAEHFPTRVSGLLLAWPINGTVLPSFTLPLYGHAATVVLLRGFATGLIGFVTFFCVLVAALAAGWPAPVAFCTALVAAPAAAVTLRRITHR